MQDEHNPYQPPNATVEGAPSPRASRPPLIALACKILWINLAVGLASLLPVVRGYWWVDPEGKVPVAVSLGIGLVLIAIFGGLYVLLVHLTGRRHNWARWALLAFLAFGWYMNLGEIAETAVKTPFAALVDVGSFFAEATACCLLFVSRDAAWFAKKGEPDGH
jgi:hypothetical protein